MNKLNKSSELYNTLIHKANLKHVVYNNTLHTFKEFRNIIHQIVEGFHKNPATLKRKIAIECKDKGEFEVELKFAGDILIFMMHTNVFEFSRDHEVMKTSYVKANKDRSYCGIINIYNFLSDSFKYNRLNDIGYLIGRVCINKDLHYFIEGKREIGFLYNNFVNAIMNKEAIRKIIESSILYTINFDLLTPPYNNVKEVTVQEIQARIDNMKIRTGKRLGYKFQADHNNIS
ncbi:MAG: hypothetical protein K8R58_15585 [Bacteroidales bacterium]|nr:hypothetical protein [Bacteroidales bacterium]